MQRYRNLDGASGVTAFETADDSIKVAFINGSIYEYDYASAGRGNIERMKRLAAEGRGLSTFISQRGHEAYARRLR